MGQHESAGGGFDLGAVLGAGPQGFAIRQSADFQHGPVAIVQDGFLVLAIVPEGKTASELTRFAKNLRARGAHLAVIAAKSRALSLGNSAFWLPRGLPEWLSPIAAVVPGQLFALGLAQARGLDPDKPRGLSKVTRTR